jgi:hypothetical protein
MTVSPGEAGAPFSTAILAIISGSGEVSAYRPPPHSASGALARVGLTSHVTRAPVGEALVRGAQKVAEASRAGVPDDVREAASRADEPPFVL